MFLRNSTIIDVVQRGRAPPEPNIINLRKKPRTTRKTRKFKPPPKGGEVPLLSKRRFSSQKVRCLCQWLNFIVVLLSL